ncbi:MAG: hypothetical protein Q9164_003728 [Protoblastenia rupestris]
MPTAHSQKASNRQIATGSPYTETVYASNIVKNGTTVFNALPATQNFTVIQGSALPASKLDDGVTNDASNALVTSSMTRIITRTKALVVRAPSFSVLGTAKAYTGLARTGWNATNLSMTKIASTGASAMPVTAPKQQLKPIDNSFSASTFRLKARDVGELVVATMDVNCSPTPQDNGSNVPAGNPDAVIVDQPNSEGTDEQPGAIPYASLESIFNRPFTTGSSLPYQQFDVEGASRKTAEGATVSGSAVGSIGIVPYPTGSVLHGNKTISHSAPSASTSFVPQVIEGAPYQNNTPKDSPVPLDPQESIPSVFPDTNATNSQEGVSGAFQANDLGNQCPPPQTVTLPATTVRLPAETVTVTEQAQVQNSPPQTLFTTVYVTVTVTTGQATSCPTTGSGGDVPLNPAEIPSFPISLPPTAPINTSIGSSPIANDLGKVPPNPAQPPSFPIPAEPAPSYIPSIGFFPSGVGPLGTAPAITQEAGPEISAVENDSVGGDSPPAENAGIPSTPASEGAGRQQPASSTIEAPPEITASLPFTENPSYIGNSSSPSPPVVPIEAGGSPSQPVLPAEDSSNSSPPTVPTGDGNSSPPPVSPTEDDNNLPAVLPTEDSGSPSQPVLPTEDGSSSSSPIIPTEGDGSPSPPVPPTEDSSIPQPVPPINDGGIPAQPPLPTENNTNPQPPPLTEDGGPSAPVPSTEGGSNPQPIPPTENGSNPQPVPPTNGEGDNPQSFPPAQTGSVAQPVPPTSGEGGNPQSIPPAQNGSSLQPIPPANGEGSNPQPVPPTEDGGSPAQPSTPTEDSSNPQSALPTEDNGSNPQPFPPTGNGSSSQPIPPTQDDGSPPPSVPPTGDGNSPQSVPPPEGGTNPQPVSPTIPTEDGGNPQPVSPAIPAEDGSSPSFPLLSPPVVSQPTELPQRPPPLPSALPSVTAPYEYSTTPNGSFLLDSGASTGFLPTGGHQTGSSDEPTAPIESLHPIGTGASQPFPMPDNESYAEIVPTATGQFPNPPNGSIPIAVSASSVQPAPLGTNLPGNPNLPTRIRHYQIQNPSALLLHYRIQNPPTYHHI